MSMFGLSETQSLWLFLAVGFLVLGYQINKLRESSKPKLKPKVEKELLWGDPIKVKHARPRNLTPDGKERWGANKHDFGFFHSFRYFGDCVNERLDDGPWRLQELGHTELRGSSASDGPAYGRRYEIFHNQCKIGSLEIDADPSGYFDHNNKSVHAEIELNFFPTALSYSRVYSLLALIASMIASTERKSRFGRSEYEEALSEIDHTLMQVMWDNQNNDFPPDLEIRLSGTPDYYFRLLDNHLQEKQEAEQASLR